jgi:DNA-binding NarL/FixJ family response regulator
MGPPRIRVSIVGGHPVVRGVVRLACREAADLELVSEIGRTEGAAEALAGDSPDIIVLDLDMPDGDGLSMLGGLRASGFTGHVLVLTDRVDGISVLEALRRGVGGYVSKADGLRGIASTLRRVVSGDRIVAPALERAALAELSSFATRAREGGEVMAALTPREHDVLVLVAEGMTIRQMGRRLGISPRTVERHVSMLYRKLGVGTRLQAVARAASIGLIDLS